MKQALTGKLSGVAVRPAMKRTSLRKHLIYFAFVSPALLLFTLIIVLPFSERFSSRFRIGTGSAAISNGPDGIITSPFSMIKLS